MGARENLATWGENLADNAIDAREQYLGRIAQSTEQGIHQSLSNLAMRGLYGMRICIALRIEELTTPESQIRVLYARRDPAYIPPEGLSS